MRSCELSPDLKALPMLEVQFGLAICSGVAWVDSGVAYVGCMSGVDVDVMASTGNRKDGTGFASIRTCVGYGSPVS